MDESILRSLTLSPKIVERLLRVFPADQLDERTHNSTFTPRETIASLADNEMIILDRIRLANLRPGSAVENIDPIARAKEHHYGEKNVFHEAEVFESRRLMTVDYLRELSDEDLMKSFTLSGSTTTIRDYIAHAQANDLFHMDELSQHLATEVATLA